MKTSRRGYSLLEVVIVMALLSIVTAALYSTVFSSTSTFTSNTRKGSIVEDARRALDAMANEIRLADKKTLLLPGALPPTGPNGGSLASVHTNVVWFQVPSSTDPKTGTVTWSNPIIYQLQPAAQMVSGVADSTAQNVVRVQGTPGGWKYQRICDFVSPGGLVITRPPSGGGAGANLLVITLTLTIQDANGKPLQTTLASSVTLRNSS